MKIEHEIEKVPIVLHRTIGDALIAGLGRHPLDGISNRILDASGLNRKTDEECELSEILHELLWGTCYERTLALVSIDREIEVHEFYLELAAHNYYPASIREAMSYLPILAKRGVEVDVVFHLGSSLRTRNFMEKRLLTKKNGDVEFVPFYYATKLKPYYNFVAVKEEKKK